MCTAPTPRLAASNAESILGNIPPYSVPSALSASARTLSISVINSPCLSKTPLILVSNINLCARTAQAISPAATSALTLWLTPASSAAIGDTTGTNSASIKASSTAVSTPTTSPTQPMSCCTLASCASGKSSFFTRIMRPSLPLTPTARTPKLLPA